MGSTECGIAIYRASRLEALLDPLVTLMDQSAPAHPLAPHTVIAAHPGMRQWLLRALAQRRGPRGVAANIEVSLPSAWLDALAQRVLGQSAVALRPYRREALRWCIHACLEAIGDARIAAYLRGEDAARRRFQLADHLARIYIHYLVYRPDWLKAWAAGRDDIPEPTFLAPLWRTLRARIGLPHRGERLDTLAAALARRRPDREDDPLHVFGISHLAPCELTMLCAVARHRLVVLYVPDPCIEYWGGLRHIRAILRDLPRDGAVADTDGDVDIGHPLLANWGRIGRHFALGLQNHADAVRIDIRHWQDEKPSATATLLQRVQESVRKLDPDLIRPVTQAHARGDASLRVHLCHTRLRELEVLRDALLHARTQDPTLKPADILVMAPDIQTYIPLIAAVFGAAGRHDGALPYHLADVAVARSHRLFEAFTRLLALPQSRFTVSDVMSLLEAPEIALALELDAAGVTRLGDWLHHAHVAWGLDAAFREHVGVPPVAESTFAWGMDRLLGGYVFGQNTQGEPVGRTLPDGTTLVPLQGVHGPDVEALGALDRLLAELTALQRDVTRPRSASAWSVRLEAMIDHLFRADPADTDAREALATLRGSVRALDAELRDAGVDPELDFDVVREALLERLGAVSVRQRFLVGAITFCGMVPQRAIPFRMIAVLGLNEGEFPRAAADVEFDPVTRHARLGDRDVRSDDRYLFLETLMAARDALHLSYIGEGVRDGKPRNPATPLDELLDLLDEHAGLRGRSRDEHDPDYADRPWWVKHPLQPFDRRYFHGDDPRLFSFRADFAELSRTTATAQATPFLATAASPAPAQECSVSPREVFAYYKDPAKQVLRNTLGLRLDALEADTLRDDEPLDAKFKSIERVGRRLVLDTVADPACDFRLPDAPPAWLRCAGLWPPGRAGEQAWSEQKNAVQALLDDARKHPLFAAERPSVEAISIDAVFGSVRVRGELQRVWRTRDALWVFDAYPDKKSEGDLGFRERIGVFLEWALLRAHAADDPRSVRAALLTRDAGHPWQGALNGWDAAYVEALRTQQHDIAQGKLDDLRRRIVGLLTFWSVAQAQPAWYFPKTSWAAACGKDDEKIAEVWIATNDRAHSERDDEPGYAAVLARDACFEPGQADLEVLKAKAGYLLALMTLNARQ
ncbi:MAG: exodeoxyribonuclease V subunit gamma [Rhodanobacter sp.]|jgi:exodeoxyribonuclease V gamma subunit|nr:exodeoxyribonuclease V subunit gamma [Rhodanobacter sp.]